MDTITLDVPLLIRLLEFAREDAPDDMALHVVAEKALRRKRVLQMKDYRALVKPSTKKAK